MLKSIVMLVAQSKAACVTSAFELVDWLRFVDVPLQTPQFVRLLSLVDRLHKPAVRDLFDNVHPAHALDFSDSDLAPYLSDPLTR